jgi:hypothetical protein
MFISQDPEALDAAWRVFDPMARGVLSLREVQVRRDRGLLMISASFT